MFLKPSGGSYSAAVTRPLTKLRLYVCQWAWLLLQLCCMIGAFLAICSMTFWTWMKWMIFFLNVFNANDFNGNTGFVHSWPTELRCSVKNPTLVDHHTYGFRSGAVSGDHSSVSACRRWQFSGVETFKLVLNEREVSLMLAPQMCWCVLWDQWSGLVIFNQMSWQIYSPPHREWLTLWRGTLAPPRSR